MQNISNELLFSRSVINYVSKHNDTVDNYREIDCAYEHVNVESTIKDESLCKIPSTQAMNIPIRGDTFFN